MSDNIKVVVKVRPLINREIVDKLPYYWRVKNDTLYQLDQNGRDNGQAFTFDRVYDKDAKTSDVYDDIAKPIVDAATRGINGTIFAYGQTSSGKTYTMSGTEASPGISQLAVFDLFNRIRNIPDRDFLLRVSYIEIYNDTIIDLLDITKDKIKIHDTLNGVKVDAIERVTSTPEEMFCIMREGDANRQIGATNMNEKSSRSHSIFQITIESRDHVKGEAESGCVNVSQLNLVDLAGSERAGQTGATGLKFKEGTHINKSLLSLALVIKQLSENQKFTNYRDCKLTRILQNSLGGNAKTSIICAVTPATVDETISTLQFANRAKAIKNKPEVNAVATSSTMIQSLTKKLAKLQSTLESKKNVEEDNRMLILKINSLQKQILNGFNRRSSSETSNRRKTWCAAPTSLDTIDEHPQTSLIPKFCTPALKYNPLSQQQTSALIPMEGVYPFATSTDTPYTPSHPTDKVNLKEEVIDLDSDNDDILDPQTCSPYHKCYGSSVTPPCILRKKAETAEKNLMDIVELTEREKIYMPSIVELMEKLEQNTIVIVKLEDEVNNLTQKCQDQDSLVSKLRTEIQERESDANVAKNELLVKCDEYDTKLAEWEFSYQTLKKKSKSREEELLSLLEEQKITETTKSKAFDEVLTNFMDMSKDVSLVQSDNENSVIIPQHSDESKCNILENQKLQQVIDNLKLELDHLEEEKTLLKENIDILNSTINSQKASLNKANDDIKSYNSVIQELHVKINEKDIKMDDETIEKMILNEERVIANNDNIKNIILNLQHTIHNRNKEVNDLKCLLEGNNIKDYDICKIKFVELEQEVSKLKKSNEEYMEEVKNLVEQNETLLNCKQNLTDCLNNIEKEHNKLKNEHETVIMEKNQELKSLKVDIETLTQLIKERKIKEQHIITENDTLLSQINDLSKEVNVLNNKNQELISHYDKIVSDKDKEVESTKENNEQLKFIIAEKETKEREVSNINVGLLSQIEQINLKTQNHKDIHQETVSKFEEVILEKDRQIECLKINNEKHEITISQNERTDNTLLQCHIEKLHLATRKIQNFLSHITGNINDELIHLDKGDNMEVIYTTLSDCLSSLEIAVTNIISEKNRVVQNNMDLRQEMTSISEEYKKKIETLNSEIERFKCLKVENENLNKQSTDLLEKLSTLSIELDLQRNQYNDLEQKYSVTLINNEKFEDDNADNESKIKLLLEKEANMNDEILRLESFLQTKEEAYEISENRLTKFKEEIEKIQFSYREKQDKFKKLVLEKDTEIELLSNSLKTMEESLKEKYENMLKYTHEANEQLNDKEELLKEILSGIQAVVDICDLDVGIIHDDDNIYKQIPNIINNIFNHVQSIKINICDNKINDSILEHEMVELTNTKNNFDKELIEFRHKLDISAEIINTLKIENGNLKKENLNYCESLETLKCELSSKDKDIDVLQTTVAQLKQNLDNLGHVAKQAFENLQADNLEVSKFRDVYENKTDISECDAPDLHYYHKSIIRESLSSIINEHKNTPPTLNSLCLSKILELLPKDTTSDSELTSSISNMDVKDNNPQTCECTNNLKVLKQLQEENVDLKRTLDHLYTANVDLTNEKEEIRREIKLLIEPSVDLFKKINNHRTSLSTLTATTYAENRLLKSQVKALQHHHIRYHNVCQRDIPELKKQLMELLSILKTDNSVHRYSLPSVLDRSANISGLKGEFNFTLDSDILMLDTNVTLNTTVDPLITQDQICLDVIHTENEMNFKSVSFDPLPNDNPSTTKKLDHFVKEKQNFKENVEKIKSSNVIETLPRETIVDYCMNCTHAEELREVQGIIKVNIKEIENLQSSLIELRKEKEDILEKHNNLILEMSSMDSLVLQMKSLESEYDCKSKEIIKLKQTLSNKVDELKRLQEENDSLSTEIMESISEADDLKTQVDVLKMSNKTWTEKYKQLESILEEQSEEMLKHTESCPQCAIKDEIIESLKTNENTLMCNKIRILKNELDASREDCKKVTEEVHTIKNQIECSNISISQGMDLDSSVDKLNMYVFPNHYDCTESQGLQNSERESTVSKENSSDLYSKDKSDCLEYYIQTCGLDKQNFNENIRILDVMKMLYDNLADKHGNKLKDFEESNSTLQSQIDIISQNYDKLSQELESKLCIITEFSRVMHKLKNNIDGINDKALSDRNATLVNIFKENILHIIDSEFSLKVTPIFDNLIMKHQAGTTEHLEKYTKLNGKLDSLTTELDIVNQNLKTTKLQLTEKEQEYNLLKIQITKMYEISNAVTMQLVKKEAELKKIILEQFQSLLEREKLKTCEIDSNASMEETIEELFKCIKKEEEKYKLEKSELYNDLTKEKENFIHDLESMKALLDEKDSQLNSIKKLYDHVQEISKAVTVDLVAKHNQLIEHETITKEHNTKLEDFSKLQNEIDILKETLVKSEAKIQNLEEMIEIYKNNETQLTDLVSKIKTLEEENVTLKQIHKLILTEKQNCCLELEKAGVLLKDREEEINNMSTEVNRLNDTLKSLRNDMELAKKQYEERHNDCIRLETNIKTHEKTAEIQCNIIKRLQKQNDDSKNQVQELSDKEKIIEELAAKMETMARENEDIIKNMKESQQEIDDLKRIKSNLETKLSELELEWESANKGGSVDACPSTARRRRQSLHDSNRTVTIEKMECDNSLEDIFGSRSQPCDLFADHDQNSDRSTPTRTSKGRDSLLRHESEQDDDSERRSSASVLAIRRRRQSIHDLHRSVLLRTPEPTETSNTKVSGGRLSNANDSDTSLRSQLEAYKQELAELNKLYKEVDEECDTCAEYLRERDEQCRALHKKNKDLSTQLAEMTEQLRKHSAMESDQNPNSMLDAAVNTDEDWANLHSVVVDRMSFDAEVEKNKRLTKALEESRLKNRELKAKVTKMHKSIDKMAVNEESGDTKDFELTRQALVSCQEELAELRKRYKELDEECDTCAQYLRERDEECLKLKDTIKELGDVQGGAIAQSTRKKRQSLHDQNRKSGSGLMDDTTNTTDENSNTKASEGRLSNANDSDTSLRSQLEAYKQELAELNKLYKEVDEECDTCAEYLRERDEQCRALHKKNKDLSTQLAEMTQLRKHSATESDQNPNSMLDAAVNTDEDWANLHSVVVDRMSFDAEVEKNKRLTKALEEFRLKNRELKAKVTKMHKSIDKMAVNEESGDTKDFELTRQALVSCQEELAELRKRYKELDEECDTCAQYLRERDDECLKLKDTIKELQCKMGDVQGGAIAQSTRKKRQSLHDQNRKSGSGLMDDTTNTTDDLTNRKMIREIEALRMTVDTLSRQKADLEHSTHHTVLATGSAIVQNQQFTDVMRENQKLKKVNAKLVNICKKRGKSMSESNRENEEPSGLD